MTILLGALLSGSSFVTTNGAVNLVASAATLTSNITQSYKMDKTGISDTSISFQKMIDSYPAGSTIRLPKGIYKLSSIVKLKDGIKLIGDGNVVIKGTGNNTLLATGDNNTFGGIEFQSCSTAISAIKQNGINITSCRFTNNIRYAAIDIYGSNDCSITNSYFYDVRKYGIKIDNNSSNITIDKNHFDNPKVFGGYKNAQISGHIYCLKIGRAHV